MTENEVLIKTPEEAIETIKSNMPTSGYQMLRESLDMAIIALKEIQQYRKIGTVEEFREAREKQIPKAPIMKPYYEDMPDEEYLCCPTCGDILTDRIPDDNKNFYFHCLNCGQKFDWREEDTK